jgi:hypothetical protein
MTTISEQGPATLIECPICGEEIGFSLPCSSTNLKVASASDELPENSSQRYRTLTKPCSRSHSIVVGFQW